MSSIEKVRGTCSVTVVNATPYCFAHHSMYAEHGKFAESQLPTVVPAYRIDGDANDHTIFEEVVIATESGVELPTVVMKWLSDIPGPNPIYLLVFVDIESIHPNQGYYGLTANPMTAKDTLNENSDLGSDYRHLKKYDMSLTRVKISGSLGPSVNASMTLSLDMTD